jgi:hypothetical protein
MVVGGGKDPFNTEDTGGTEENLGIKNEELEVKTDRRAKS